MNIPSDNKKILVAHAFFLKNDSKQLSEKFKPYPPLAALYGISLLRNKGYEVDLFDAVLADNLNNFEQNFVEKPPALLVIYEDDFNFLTKMCLSHVREATLKMIDIAKSSQLTVIIHSSDASDNPNVYLSRGADFIIYGEAEQTLAELVDYCFDDKRIKLDEVDGIDGIYYLSDSRLIKTAQRKTLKQLDELPQPAWDLVEFKEYRQAWQQKHGLFSLNMVTTRGCPYHCNWCAKPIWGQQYQSHSPEYIASQLAWLVKNVSPDHIWFADDIFGLKKGWIESFAQQVNQLQIQVPFMIQSRADLIDDKVVKALKLAGCEEVWLGVESGSQSVLDNMDKGITLAQVKTARKLLAQAEINVGFFIQLGYPDEDIKDINSTRQMLLDLQPEKIGVSVSYPLPGTLFFQRVAHQLAEKTNWLESNDLDTVFCSTYTAKFYRMVREHLHAELVAEKSQTKSVDWDDKWQQLIRLSDDYLSEQPSKNKRNLSSIAQTSQGQNQKKQAQQKHPDSARMGVRINVQML